MTSSAPRRTADNARFGEEAEVPENETAKKIRHEIAVAGLCGFDSLDQIRGLLSDAANEVEKLAQEAAQLRSRLLEAEKGAEAMRWQRTGTSTQPIGNGRGENQWFRSADGSIRMFPMGFDPNSGTYGRVIMHRGFTVYLCPGETFIPAPDPLAQSPEESGDA